MSQNTHSNPHQKESAQVATLIFPSHTGIQSTTCHPKFHSFRLTSYAQVKHKLSAEIPSPRKNHRLITDSGVHNTDRRTAIHQ